MLAGGSALKGVRLAVGGGGSGGITLSSLSAPIQASGAGASLVSTSPSQGVMLSTSPLVGNTSGVTISTGSASSSSSSSPSSAGDIALAAGDGDGVGGRGGSITLRPGAGGGSGSGSGSSSVSTDGGVELYDASGSATPLISVRGGGVKVGGLAGLSLTITPAPPGGAPILILPTSTVLEVLVSSGTSSPSPIDIDISTGVADGQVVWILNSPASSGGAAVLASDGILACDGDVDIPRGRMAGFITVGCGGSGSGCLLVPL